MCVLYSACPIERRINPRLNLLVNYGYKQESGYGPQNLYVTERGAKANEEEINRQRSGT